jgi:hypothetical protein
MPNAIRIRGAAVRRAVPRASIRWLGTCAGLACAAGALTLSPAAAAQAVVNVQGYGVDAAGCGAADSPCRSITRALAEVRAGGTIRVGPGRYGDVERNGLFDLGDEGPAAQPFADKRRWSVIPIEKPVTIISTHGAEVTTIDIGPDVSPTGAARRRHAITIHADGVTLGTAGHGFRVIGGQAPEEGGVWVVDGASNVRVSGNIVEGYLDPVGTRTGGGIHVEASSAQVLVTDNQMLHGSIGADLVLQFPDSALTDGPVSAFRNVVRDNNLGAGIVGKGITFSAGVVDGNGLGVIAIDEDVSDGGMADDPSRPRVALRDNWFTSNGEYGLHLGSVGAVVRNAVLGNVRGGVNVQVDGIVLNFQLNNVFGNGVVAAGIYPHLKNCGFVTTTTFQPVARNDYWGAATGPGPDPADDSAGLGHPCMSTVAVLDTPFATTPFVIVPPVVSAAPLR